MVLEALGLKYETNHIDISKNTQKEEWYLKINRTISPFLLRRLPYFVYSLTTFRSHTSYSFYIPPHYSWITADIPYHSQWTHPRHNRPH